jgi:hypothetical protein
MAIGVVVGGVGVAFLVGAGALVIFYAGALNTTLSPDEPEEPSERVPGGSDLHLEGPGDKSTPPTYLEKGLLLFELVHNPSEGGRTHYADFSDYNFIVVIQDSEGQNVPGGHIWKVGDYEGAQSVTIPEGGYYTVQATGQSPWWLDATLYPTR